MLPQRIRRRGSAVLDAALVFPVLLSLTFGCVEFGHYFYIKHTLQGAAREGTAPPPPAPPTATSPPPSPTP
ncbi:MAG: pilus assembly protein [Tepidisphaeraceae bacterium]